MIKNLRVLWRKEKEMDISNKEIELLKFVTAGSVDDGKSTLIGRLLYETKTIFEDQLESIKRLSKQKGSEYLDLSLIVDGLKAEREQGITIDVAHRYFSTPKRKFIIADTPGHIQYTKNMITGASNSELIIILIDAEKGITEQTKRHSFIASLLRIPHIIVCINKMDLVNYSEEKFNKIKEEYEKFSLNLKVKDIQFIPLSALKGENITNKTKEMTWWKGQNLIEILENIKIEKDINFTDARFPIQYVIRPRQKEFYNYRGYAGQIASGVFKKGDKIIALPSEIESEIESIEMGEKEIDNAHYPLSIRMKIKGDIDLGRGDMIVKKDCMPNIGNEFNIIICWLNKEKMSKEKKYIIKHTSREVKGIIKKIDYKIDINTMGEKEGEEIMINDIAKIKIKTSEPIFYDVYEKNKLTGSLILIDEYTNETMAAGMIIS
jgi:sulfate adenylyltransferase subunit 1